MRYEIIHSGSEQPEIFHLVGLFEENVEPDRLSDMVARIIYSDIVAYSKRIYRTLGIDRESYPEYKFSDGIVINPYKNIKLLLLPVELLHELPIARCWDDIDRVCRENEAIRAEINDLVGNTWAKMRSAEKKQYLRNWIFMNPERAGRIIDSYKASTVARYDPLSDLDYLVGYLQNTFNANSDGDDDSFSAAMEIVDNYQEWVEYHRGAVVIQEANSRSKEKTVQRTIHAVALVFCKKFNWDTVSESGCFMATEAQRKAIRKYTEKLDEVRFRVPSGELEKFKAHAETQGESLAAFMRRTASETMANDQKKF